MRDNQILTGSILSYTSKFINIIISLIYTPFMLRMIGQGEYGLYSIATSIIGFLSILDFGFGNTIIRYVAKYKEEGDKEGEYSLNGMFVLFNLFASVLAIVIGAIIYFNIGHFYSSGLGSDEVSKVKIMLTILIFNVACSFPLSVFSAILTAYEKFVFVHSVNTIRLILNPLIMLPILLLGYKSIALVVVTTAFNIITLVINMLYCIIAIRIRVSFKNMRFKVFREITHYSTYVFLGIIVDRVFWSTDQIILGAVKGSGAVAVYSIGLSFYLYMMTFSSVFSSMLLPRFTQISLSDFDMKETNKLFIRISRLQFVITGLILFGFIAIGKEFISIWAGKEYAQSYIVAIIIMSTVSFGVVQSAGMQILFAQNKHRFRGILKIILAVLNVLLTIPLARLYGGIGCAIATAVAHILFTIIISVYYHKVIRLDVIKLWKELSVFIPAIAIIAILSSLFAGFISNPYTKLIGGTLIFVTLYSVLIIKKFFNCEEKQLAVNIIKRIPIIKKWRFLNDYN